MPFSDSLRDQVRKGTSVCLAGGFLLGLLLSAAFFTQYHANLVLPDTYSRIYALLFFPSFVSLLAAIGMFPIEALAAAVKWNASRGFYASILVAGAWLCYGALRLRFQGPGDHPASGIHLAFAFLFAVIVLFWWKEKKPAAGTFPPGWILVNAILLLSFLMALGFNRLSDSRLQALPFDGERVAASPKLENAPNILLISIDTLRADHLGCYGYSRNTTPNLDRLCQSSIVFKNALSPAPWTLPAHASMLTGLYPSSHGARFSSQHAPVLDRLDEGILTSAEILAAASYDTAAFSSVFWLSRDWGTLQGFRTSESRTSAPADFIVDRALEWLKRDRQQPFFLFLHFFDVHDYNSPLEFDSRFQDPDYKGALKNQPLQTSRNAYRTLSQGDLRYLVAKYDGALSYVDHELGRLFAALDSAGHSARTAVIVTSDHGEEFFEHGGTGHGFTLYQEALAVPLMMKLPGQAGVVVDTPVSILDVFPTMLDWAALPVPPGIQGVSLRSARPAERLLFAEDTYFMNSCAIREGNYKLIDNRIPPVDLLNPRMFLVNIRSFFKFSAPELYHLESDSFEKRNLAEQERKRLEMMRAKLSSHVKIENVGEQGELEDEMREKMRSLGYVQ